MLEENMGSGDHHSQKDLFPGVLWISDQIWLKLRNITGLVKTWTWFWHWRKSVGFILWGPCTLYKIPFNPSKKVLRYFSLNPSGTVDLIERFKHQVINKMLSCTKPRVNKSSDGGSQSRHSFNTAIPGDMPPALVKKKRKKANDGQSAC